MPPFGKSPKPDPAAMYICLDSFTYRGADGQDHTIREDQRLLGSSEAVTKHPEMFILDGQPDDAVRQAKSDRLQAAIAKAIGQ